MVGVPYGQLLDDLLSGMQVTRPDLAFAVGSLSSRPARATVLVSAEAGAR
jgi:hypothetical protein